MEWEEPINFCKKLEFVEINVNGMGRNQELAYRIDWEEEQLKKN